MRSVQSGLVVSVLLAFLLPQAHLQSLLVAEYEVQFYSFSDIVELSAEEGPPTPCEWFPQCFRKLRPCAVCTGTK